MFVSFGSMLKSPNKMTLSYFLLRSSTSLLIICKRGKILFLFELKEQKTTFFPHINFKKNPSKDSF